MLDLGLAQEWGIGKTGLGEGRHPAGYRMFTHVLICPQSFSIHVEILALFWRDVELSHAVALSSNPLCQNKTRGKV
jgi:hypothetical protein